jgi:protoporphyrin/coproporphyrin ferrochelatase
MATILLLNMGGPSTLGEVRPFLRNLFADPMLLDLPGGVILRPFLSRLIPAVRTRRVQAAYASIGGGSPLLRTTRAQAAALGTELVKRGHPGAQVEVVMRYTPPRAAEVLARLAARGETRALALPLYPQECRATTGSSLAELQSLRPRLAPSLRIETVRSWHLDPGYLDLLAKRVRNALDSLPEAARPHATILFSAHGVPVALPRRGDPYVGQVKETVAAVVARLGAGHAHRLGWQSRTGPVKWIGPGTDDVIAELAGAEAVVVVPVSFVSDHIETLYEIDILFAEEAHRVGIRHFVRTAALDIDPGFIAALAGLAEPFLAGPGAADAGRTDVAAGRS